MNAHYKPTPVNVIRDDFTTGRIEGKSGSDHLIHHRDASVTTHQGTGLAGFGGDDILEASVPNMGQVHMFGSSGNDWLILDTTKVANAGGVQGHHAYGGHGRDTFQFTNIEDNNSPIIGRLDDFDPSADRIMIEDTVMDLTDLPKTITLSNGEKVEVRVIEIEHPEFKDENLGTQYFLAIGDNIFYALEGARDLQNGTSGMHGEERHFLDASALDTLRTAEAVQYVNPKNFVPLDFYEHRLDELHYNGTPHGADVTANTGDKSAANMYGGKANAHAHHSSGEQTMRGSDGDDVIDGNTGNDLIFGGDGNDLLAGGIDNDVIHGDAGDDMIWGGDGDDILFGGKGDDYLHGGRGDDWLYGGMGNDTIVGGFGNDTLTGGGGDDAVNRFHFFDEDGEDVILDFKVDKDLITFQDDVDPLTVELYQNEDGNAVINYGQSNSVELRGVSIEDFREAAEIRADEDNPIITITTDPEEEALQAIRIESGYFGDDEPPSLYLKGVKYGADAFNEAGPGGYAYATDICCSEGGHHGAHDDGDHDHHDHYHANHDHGGHAKDHGSDDGSLLLIPPKDEEEVVTSDDDDDEATFPTCFVATAAYRDPWHPDVVFLRAFRDQWLVNRPWGRAFIAFYWRVGPRLATPVRNHPRLANISRGLIGGIVTLLRRTWGTQARQGPVIQAAVQGNRAGHPASRKHAGSGY